MTQSKCIVKIGDYISRKTIQQLTQDQYQEFRSYLRTYAYNVADELGIYEKSSLSETYNYIHFDKWGDLVWSSVPGSGNEIYLNQILGVIANKHIIDESCNSRQQELDNIDSIIGLHIAALAELQQQRDEIKVRRTGRTLGIAFATLGSALTNPNTNITVIDHDNKPQTNSLLVEHIETLIEKLGLKNIHVNKTKRVIRYVLSK